jgi:EF-hand domain pair
MYRFSPAHRDTHSRRASLTHSPPHGSFVVGSGYIDKTELAKAMKVLRLDVAPRELDGLFTRFDKDGRGRLDYNDFLQLLGFNADNARRASTKDHAGEMASLLAVVRRKLEDNLGADAQVRLTPPETHFSSLLTSCWVCLYVCVPCVHCGRTEYSADQGGLR